MFCSMILDGKPLPTVQSEVVVPWWSFTKTVLAAAALSLVRDGLIHLDEPVQEGPFTLRQLLTHQAGLADYSELKDYHSAVAAGQQPWSAAEMMARLDGNTLRYVPGAAWRYSNVGYMLVRQLIERVTDSPIEEALAQRVFAPLSLTHVQFLSTADELAAITTQDMASYHPGWVYHGLLVGPLSEAAKLLDQLLTGPLLPPSLLLEMQDALVLGGAMPGRPWATPGYGLGLMIGDTNTGHRLVGHTGVGPGGIIAVYHSFSAGHAATCSVFSASGSEGEVEETVLEELLTVVGNDQLSQDSIRQ